MIDDGSVAFRQPIPFGFAGDGVHYEPESVVAGHVAARKRMVLVANWQTPFDDVFFCPKGRGKAQEALEQVLRSGWNVPIHKQGVRILSSPEADSDRSANRGEQEVGTEAGLRREEHIEAPRAQSAPVAERPRSEEHTSELQSQ